MRALLLAGLLCACSQREDRFPEPIGNYEPPAPVSLAGAPPMNSAEQAEYTRLERACLEASDQHRQMRGWDCGWAGLDDARAWDREYRARAGQRP